MIGPEDADGLSGKVALISGGGAAGDGIGNGRAAAILLARAGAKVLVADRDAEIRSVLFPAELAMPAGCSIKGKFAVRARLTGNVGIYHLRGCLSYAGTTHPDRWFCSEDDAQAAGFRRAYNCRSSTSRK